MKNVILFTSLHTILTGMLSAQDPTPMTRTSNWLWAGRELLGSTTAASWLMDLAADEMELYLTPEHSLVIVDRTPITARDGTAYLRKGVQGLGGTRLSLVGEVQRINDSVMHGTYSGLLAGTAVLMDQFVELRNGVPVTMVWVVARVNGPARATADTHQELALGLIAGPDAGPDRPGLTRY